MSSLSNKLLAGAADLPGHLAEVVAPLSPDLKQLVEQLPERLMDVAANAPVYLDRRSAAALLTRYVFPVSHRSLEVWRVPWQHVNGKAIGLTVVLLAVGYAKLAAAPVIMGGRGAASEHHA